MTRRPATNTPLLFETAAKLYREGCSCAKVAKQLSYSESQMYRILRRAGVEIRKKIAQPKLVNSGGYVLILDKSHPKAGRDGYVLEHILKAEKALGRPLKKGEVVHHINGNKADNRNCNLLICTNQYHTELHQRMSLLYQKEHFSE